MQQNFLIKLNNENEAVVKASFQVAHLLAKQGKPIRDELIKLFLIAAAKEMCPDKRNLFKTVSARIVAQRVENIGNSVHGQLINKANKFEWFSLALDR